MSIPPSPPSQAELIAQLERTAAAAGVPMLAACRAAGIASSTFYRWRAGQVMPWEGYRRLLAAIEAASSAPAAGSGGSAGNLAALPAARLLVRRP